jgi:prolyl oligopeptidase
MPLCTTFAVTLALAPTLAAVPAPPPPTRQDGVTDTYFGTEIRDDFRWLEALEKESPEVAEWTTQQNDRTRAVLDGLPCRKSFEERLTPLMSIGSVGAPQMRGNRYFHTERTGTQNQAVLKLREGFDGPSRTLLDVNALDAKGLTSLDWWRPNQAGTVVAFGTSVAGSEMSELHLLEVATGAWLADEIVGKVSFGAWTPDGSGFVYSVLRDPKDPYSREIRYHEVGRSPRFDRVIERQVNPSEIPFGSLTEDGRWLIVGFSRGWQANDLMVADFAGWLAGRSEPKPVAKGLDARFTPQASLGDTMWMMTTLDSPNARLVAVDLNDPGNRASWRDVIPERKDEVLEGVSLARGMLVANFSKDACTRFELFRHDGTSIGPVPLPGLGTASLSTEDDRTEAFLTYTSYDDPRSIYRIDLAKPADRTLWARPEVPADLSKLTVEMVRAKSKDGTSVPIFVVRRKDLSPNGNNPTLLYGYGGFNVSLTPSFNPTLLPWVEDGGIYAVALLRGGGEYGERWHQAGMRGNKQNVFDDFYAAAEHLVAEKWTSPARLACEGGSNGGLLTGVAVTQRPELFAAAISAVPLLDMLRFHDFLIARYWVPEYGSSETEEGFGWLRAYSPYQNVKKGTRYPSVLFTAGENDSRVHPFHARKMAALMQRDAANGDDRPILLWVDRDAGHGQGKPLALRIRDEVDQWSFLAWQLGACK